MAVVLPWRGGSFCMISQQQQQVALLGIGRQFCSCHSPASQAAAAVSSSPISTSWTVKSRSCSLAGRRGDTARFTVRASQEVGTSTRTDPSTAPATTTSSDSEKTQTVAGPANGETGEAEAAKPKPKPKPAVVAAVAVAAADGGKPTPKAAKKAPVVKKSLEASMLEDVIPQLTATLEKEAGLTDLSITFEANQLKTSFSKGDVPYCHWAFFPDGSLEGPRGASLTSYGSPPSTLEPFLVDENKITPELVVFWIRKRLFAQKILSVN